VIDNVEVKLYISVKIGNKIVMNIVKLML